MSKMREKHWGAKRNSLNVKEVLLTLLQVFCNYQNRGAGSEINKTDHDNLQSNLAQFLVFLGVIGGLQTATLLIKLN
jgi:hypothetical protein